LKKKREEGKRGKKFKEASPSASIANANANA
jgi:hypothetical protein